jgi:hypothetical protein
MPELLVSLGADVVTAAPSVVVLSGALAGLVVGAADFWGELLPHPAPSSSAAPTRPAERA